MAIRHTWRLHQRLVIAVLGIGLLLPSLSSADPPPSIAADQPPTEAPPAAPESQPSTLTVGKRVRVTTTMPSGRVDGDVSSMDDKVLTIVNRKKGTLSIPWPAVSGLDVQVGYRRPLLKVALIGGAGTFALLFFGSAFLLPAEDFGDPKWVPLVPPFYRPVAPGPVSVQLTPVRAGIAAQLTLRF